MSRSFVVVAALALSACGIDPQGGYRPVPQMSGTVQQPASFEPVNAQCWTVSMNNAGFGASTPQWDAYKSCMGRNGWEDRRQLF